jgi:Ca-activated chloride channel homolog
MGILLPAALALIALAIPIVIFYMLRLRRDELSVSSSMLWRRVLQDRTANAPWQRLRRNLLLLLQLLLLLLLVLGLARPFVFSHPTVAGNLVLVLDGSASMQTADEAGGESRFARAINEAGALIDGMGSDARATLIWAGPQALTVVQAGGDRAALHAAVRGLTPSNGRADIGAAVTLAGASARQLGNATVALISDGALEGVDALPAVPAEARYINVGKSASNLAITSLSLRDASDGPQLFAGLYNNAGSPASVLLTVSVGGQLRDSRKVTLAAGEEQNLTIEGLPLDARMVEAHLTADDQSTDLLSADNTAWALSPHLSSQNVLLVSEGNGFIEKALNLVPGVHLSKTAPTQYAPSDGFGLTVLDATMPQDLPAGNLLLLAPPNSPLLPISGTLQYPAIGQVDVNDPLLRFVDLSAVHIAVAQRIVPPSWARVPVRTSSGDPLILAGETGGRRVVALAFDLHQTDLPLQVAFPILVSNLVEWLQPQNTVNAPPTLGAGDPISINALPDADEIVVTPPGEGAKSTVLTPSGSTSFAGTDRLGIYTVVQRAKGQPVGEPEQFAVNLFSRDESNITPHADLAFVGANESLPAGNNAANGTPLEIWPWVLLAGLAILALEWWVYNRAGGISLKWRRPRPS